MHITSRNIGYGAFGEPKELLLNTPMQLHPDSVQELQSLQEVIRAKKKELVKIQQDGLYGDYPSKISLMVLAQATIGATHLRSLSCRPSSKSVHLPNLQSVDGNVEIYAPTKADNLTYCNGTLLIESSFIASKLEKIKGDLLIDTTNPIDLSGLRFAKSLTLFGNSKFDYSNIKFADGEVIAVSEYVLCYNEETQMYTAGCRGPWSAKEALQHWQSVQRDRHIYINGTSRIERADIFVEAIEKNEQRVKC